MKLKHILSVVAILFCLSLIGCGDFGKGLWWNGSSDDPLRPLPTPEKVHAKHIILVIGDGMHLEHEIASSRYLYGNDSSLAWHSYPYQSFVTTWDINTYNMQALNLGRPFYDPETFIPDIGYDVLSGGVAPFPIDPLIDDAYFLSTMKATDSASSATALSTGMKTDGGNIAWLTGDPPDGSIETIAEKMRAKLGVSIGVVSSVPFNHATPAAFVSHNVNRSNLFTGKGGYTGLGIADEIIQNTKPDVVLGGGLSTGYMTLALIDELKNSTDYVFVMREAGVDGTQALVSATDSAIEQGLKLFGLFGGGAGNLEPPVPSDTPGSPDVQEATSENPSVAEMAQAALKVLSRDEDGFFLMVEQGDVDWANHNNDYDWMIGAMSSMDEMVRAIQAFVDMPDDAIDWSNTLLIVTADHGNSYMRLTDTPVLGKGDLPAHSGAWYMDGEVTYGTSGHTNELVTFYAKGNAGELLYNYEGLWYPGTIIIDNTHIFRIMAEASGVLD